MPPRALPAKSSNWQWLSSAAFILALSLVAGRMMMNESLTSTADLAPGPRNIGGPVTSIFLDVLCVLPAILILIRRLADRAFALSWKWSLPPLLLLAIWMMLSERWAVNRFDALVSSLHFAAAGAMLWAGLQLVRSWGRLRIVAAVCFGLLLVYVAQGLFSKLMDAPALREYWNANKTQILKDRHYAEGSPQAVMLEKKVLSGELMGFSVSPNTYAACIVLFIVVTMGVTIQRYVERDQAAWAVPAYGVGILFGAVILVLVQSKASAIAPIIAVGIFALLAHYRDKFARNWKRVYLVCVAVLVVAVVMVVGHGLFHGTLPTSSLNFRWQYWVASARLFRDHLWRGVGWSNFGLYYLHYRLPQAPEEIQDPHNFAIHVLTELGLIGGVLALTWIARLWWEIARPIQPAADVIALAARDHGKAPAASQVPEAVKLFAGIGFIAMLIGYFGSTDLATDKFFIVGQLFQRLIYFLVFLIGSSLVGVESLQEPRLSTRPAPWILYALFTAVGLFLLQNIVDFSMFEPGPMFLLMLLIGAALGLRTQEPTRNARATPVAAAGLFAVVAACTLAMTTLWPATATADELQQQAIQKMPTDLPAGIQLLQEADRAQPLNPFYLTLAARTLVEANPPPAWDGRVRQLLADAIAKNPRDISLYNSRITYLKRVAAFDAAPIIGDFEKLIDLNPTDIDTRIRYGDYLDQFGQKEAARQQYREALRLNDALGPKEIKRLENQPGGKEELTAIRQKAK